MQESVRLYQRTLISYKEIGFKKHSPKMLEN